MITTAVILAAGMGSRLRRVHDTLPKGFVELGGESLIAESVRKLKAQGIDRIVIGTGFGRDYYEAFSKKFRGITCVHNPEFASTGSMATLRYLREAVSSDFLLLESDLTYECDGLARLLDHPESDVILASEVTSYGDELFISTSAHGHLKDMSKQAEQLDTVEGVLVGIAKISLGTFHLLCQHFDSTGDRSMSYEDALVAAAGRQPIAVLNAGALTWSEIDTPEHLAHAQSTVYPEIHRKETRPLVRRNVLLNPGPATTTDSVKYAQVVPDICPREKEFSSVLAEIRERVVEVAAHDGGYEAVLFGGSGTAAVEAILSSVIGEEDYLCVVNNGAYGARMAEIGRIHNLKMTEYVADPLSGVNLEQLAQLIDRTPRQVTHVAMVHHETTTGILNDLAGAGNICRERGIVLIVDAISSFGAIPIDMRGQGIHFLAATANKNLQGMPGVSFVVADVAALERTASLPPRSLYLNLYREFAHVRSTGQTRFTPAVQTCYALRQALRELKIEGVHARYERYCACWETLTAGLSRIGLKLVVAPEHQSKLLTTIQEPSHPRYSFEAMHDAMLRRGFTVYPGKLSSQNTFRIANIGALVPEDINLFVRHLKEYLKSL